VVWFCSATAPLTVSNTGRIASIACGCDARHRLNPRRPFAALDLFGDFFGAFCVCTASALTSVATTAKPPARLSGPRRFEWWS